MNFWKITLVQKPAQDHFLWEETYVPKQRPNDSAIATTKGRVLCICQLTWAITLINVFTTDGFAAGVSSLLSRLLEARKLLGSLWGTSLPLHLPDPGGQMGPWGLPKPFCSRGGTLPPSQPQAEVNWGPHLNWHSRILSLPVLWSALASGEEGYILERAGDTLRQGAQVNHNFKQLCWEYSKTSAVQPLCPLQKREAFPPRDTKRWH